MQVLSIDLSDDDRALLRQVLERVARIEAHVVPGDGLISTAEAAALLGVRETTIRQWARDGTLEVAARVGQRLRFRREDIIPAEDA